MDPDALIGLAGAAVGAVATMGAVVLTERYRVRAAAERQRRETLEAQARRIADQQASDHERREYEALEWLRIAGEIRQVTSAALQELLRNSDKVRGGRALDNTDWTYLDSLGTVTHQSVSRIRDEQVLGALWDFSTQVRNSKSTLDKFDKGLAPTAKVDKQLRSQVSDAIAARTHLMEMVFDRVRRRGFALPGRPSDW